MKNISININPHFENFIAQRVLSGAYKNEDEIIIAALKLLEEEELKYNALKNAINEGLNSETDHKFDSRDHLASLKSRLQ